MEKLDLLIIENHMQSTLLDKYITFHHPKLLKNITVMPNLLLQKRNKTLQIYSHPFKEAPVIYIYGANKDNISSLAFIHQFYPFGFIKFPHQGSCEYALNDPPPCSFSSINRVDSTLVVPSANEYQFMLDLYNKLSNLNIPLMMLSLHQYTSIYGLNPIEKFVKIIYLNPNDRAKLLRVFTSGTLNHKFICFNFHFNYSDVFMREFDLQGCYPLSFNLVKYRCRQAIPNESWLSLISSSTLSTLSIEFDTIANEVNGTSSIIESQPFSFDDDVLGKSWMHRKWNIPTVKALWYDEYIRRIKHNLNEKLPQNSIRDAQRYTPDAYSSNKICKPWAEKYRLLIDKLISELPSSSGSSDSTVHSNYQFHNSTMAPASDVFECLIALISNHLDSYPESNSSHILTNGDSITEDDDLIELLATNLHSSDDSFSNSSESYFINNSLESDMNSCESGIDDIVLQVDGQVDKKQRLIEVLVPIKKKRAPLFKPLNIIDNPTTRHVSSSIEEPSSSVASKNTHRNTSVFSGGNINMWSPVEESNTYDPLSCSVNSSPVDIVRASYIYTTKPPLFANAASLTNVTNTRRLSSYYSASSIGFWMFIKSPPYYSHTSANKSASIKDSTDSANKDLSFILCKVLVVEIIARSSNSYYNPGTDKITCIAFGLQLNWQEYCNSCSFITNEDEHQLLTEFIAKVKQIEPDIIIGWDISNESIGYIAKRCSIYNIDLLQNIARIDNGLGPSNSLNGRLLLDAWRICRNIVDTRLYTIEHLYYSLFKESFPIPAKFELNNKRFAIDYIQRKCKAILRILDETDFICQTVEFSQLYGIPFASVLSRGSQYRVESALYRICKQYRLLMASPTKEQVNDQQAAEFIPLVMEPSSQFYSEPVSVLDFQSLYPSIMIAYNYCYSTIICKLTDGASGRINTVLGSYERTPCAFLLKRFYENLIISPNGGVFVSSRVKEGILTRLVVDLLDTRVMIKESMKLYRSNKSLTKLLNARQLALKLLANVIYGYTSASFSGRMPMVEVADAIVGMGRMTLKETKEFITKNYDVAIRYGDTDSLFVECTHYSVEGAMALSRDIIVNVTKMNPNPITFKFEKLYLKCFLLTKKRYCGYKIENLGDTPTFEGKGIETVRRDGCFLVSHLLQESLIYYFKNQSVVQFKSYLYNLFRKLDKYPLHYFIIAKEIRIGTYKQYPPGAIVAQRQMESEEGYKPLMGYRQPYVVIYNTDKLRENAVGPMEYLNNKDMIINRHYYINKQLLPVFNRIFQFTTIKVNDIAGALGMTQSNPRYWIEPKESMEYHTLHEQCQACLNITPMHGRPIKCINYSCVIFEAKLRLHGELF
eukprot:NODE_68_length_23780_cov_0.251003.p1 type:complete len:1334 gc:universal NODE_68_length_23780_cov_0.251003:10528-14529(+)